MTGSVSREPYFNKLYYKYEIEVNMGRKQSRIKKIEDWKITKLIFVN